MAGTKRDSGRKGGQVTLERYGKDQLAYWGKYGKEGGKPGGRPRAQTYDDIRQQQRREQNNNKGGNGSPGNNLRQLRTQLKLQRQGSNGADYERKTQEAGIAQVTPRGQVPAGKEAR